MNILFLTLSKMENIEERGIYTDLLRVFRNNGHHVYTITPYEKRTGLKSNYVQDENVHMLHVSVGNITKCGMIEKGISTLRIESQFLVAIKKYYSNVKFDLVLYSTPPITFAKVIRYIKVRDCAKTYLLLKDIFPQNAVDIGVLSKRGLKGLLYMYFRYREKELYKLSDHIGCMSQANVDYVLFHNQEIEHKKVGITPNSIEVIEKLVNGDEKKRIRKKYDIPLEKTIFVYGGNLGKPQGIDFLIQCLKSQNERDNVCFLIIGDGTEYKKLETYINIEQPPNVRLMRSLPKEEFESLVAACDVGMIFLDHRFTIPNFPSRLLSYMQAPIPVLAVTDPNTDIGEVIKSGGFGWWCISNDTNKFDECIEEILNSSYDEMKVNEKKFLKDNYSVEIAYKGIMDSL